MKLGKNVRDVFFRKYSLEREIILDSMSSKTSYQGDKLRTLIKLSVLKYRYNIRVRNQVFRELKK